MKIIRNAPKLELTEREYRLLDDTYALIAAINNNLLSADWNYLSPHFDASLLDVKNAIGTLMDWSRDEL
jgi:hypothetical protein